MKKFLTVSVVIIAALLTGCAGTSNFAKSNAEYSYKLPKASDGIVYGAAAVMTIKDVVATMCESIKGADARCSSMNEYEAIQVYSAFGFNAGGATTLALLKKNSPMLSQISYFDGRLGNSKQPFVKVKAGNGTFGEILEVVSVNGDGKCKWSGLPRAGGTVCPAYDWDYRKELNDWSNPRGILSVD